MSQRPHGSELLARYLDGPPKRSQTRLSELVGKTQQTISRWKGGEDQPKDFETQLILEQATEGAVPVESWLSDEAAAQFEEHVKAIRRKSRSASTSPTE